MTTAPLTATSGTLVRKLSADYSDDPAFTAWATAWTDAPAQSVLWVEMVQHDSPAKGAIAVYLIYRADGNYGTSELSPAFSLLLVPLEWFTPENFELVKTPTAAC